MSGCHAFAIAADGQTGSMEYGVWSMEYGVWSMEYGVWSMEYGK